MVDYKYADLFLKPHTEKQLIISADDGSVVIRNDSIYFENFELEESLCSESDLKFGSCEASSVKFKIANVFIPLKDKWITIKMVLDGHEEEPLQIGKYKVVSDVPTADRRHREVTAYDCMADIINKEVSSWYNSLSFPMTIKTLRDSFFSYIGVEQETVTLPNDSMTVEKTIDTNELSSKDLICAICEANGAFGHINRSGKFVYIFLGEIIEGLYPKDDLLPSNDLYPRDSNTQSVGSASYIGATYEDYEKKKITSLQIRQEENDIGTQIGVDGNNYIIQGNFLFYGKSVAELEECGARILDKIGVVWYTPTEVQAVGNLCLEVGDAIRVNTTRKIIYTYILNRKLSGIQALRDSYSAEGEEYYTQKVNSISTQIEQLKGKTNVLTRTSEETKSQLSDLEESTNSKISQTADAIQAEVTARQGGDSEIKGLLELKIDKDDDGTVISLINGSADRIHFNANNMFTVNSPYFKVNEIGQLELGGDITADTALYLTYQLYSANPKINVLSVAAENYTSYFINDSERPYKITTLEYLGVPSAPVLRIGTAASVVMIDKQVQVSEMYSNLGMLEELIVNDANIGSLWLKSYEGDYGGAVYMCNGGYGDNGIASPGWVKKYVENQPDRGITSVQYTWSDSPTTKYAPRYFNVLGGIMLSVEGLLISTSSSDKRLKDNIREMRDIKAVYMAIRPVEYEWKQGYVTTQKGLQFGIIAQDLEEILQEHGIFDSGLVLKEVAEEDEKKIHGDEYTYKLDKENLHAMHIQMIQSQQAEIETLKTQVLNLQGDLAILKQEVEEMKNAINHKDN